MTAAETMDLARLRDGFLRICPQPEHLVAPAGYRDSSLALIDAIFSMQARYESVLTIVHRYAAWANIEVAGLPIDAGEPDQHDLGALGALIGDLEGEDLAREVFGSRAKSPSSNRLKAALVVDAASRLRSPPVNVVARQDVEQMPAGARHLEQKRAWASVVGLGPITFEYFRMLCGAESSKPDIMVVRWLEATTGRRPTWQQALVQIRELTDALEQHWGQPVSQRAVDHTIWLHQSGRQQEAVVHRPEPRLT